MEESEALTRLKMMTAWDKQSTLSEDELALLLADARVVDSSGIAPITDGYTASWNLDYAAREGWIIKAGKAASQFDFGSDVNRFSRSQLIAACKSMAEMYDMRLLGTIVVQPVWETLDPVIGNLNGGN